MLLRNRAPRDTHFRTVANAFEKTFKAISGRNLEKKKNAYSKKNPSTKGKGGEKKHCMNIYFLCFPSQIDNSPTSDFFCNTFFSRVTSFSLLWCLWICSWRRKKFAKKNGRLPLFKFAVNNRREGEDYGVVRFHLISYIRWE